MVLELYTSIFILTYLYGSYMSYGMLHSSLSGSYLALQLTTLNIKMQFKYKKVNTMRLKKKRSNLLIFQFVQAILKHDIGCINI